MIAGGLGHERRGRRRSIWALFLIGVPACVRPVTTRVKRVLPESAEPVVVDPMDAHARHPHGPAMDRDTAAAARPLAAGTSCADPASALLRFMTASIELKRHPQFDTVYKY
jgi:hypothetical protein